MTADPEMLKAARSLYAKVYPRDKDKTRSFNFCMTRVRRSGRVNPDSKRCALCGSSANGYAVVEMMFGYRLQVTGKWNPNGWCRDCRNKHS